MRRRTATVVAAAAITTLVASCTTTGGSTATRESNGPVTLTFWNTGTDEHAASLQAAANLYKQSHPDVTIKVQAISWDDGHAKVLAAATSRSGPDIISGGLSWGIEFGQLGGVIDLRRYGIDQIQHQNKPGLWNSIKSIPTVLFFPLLPETLHSRYRAIRHQALTVQETA
jgi:multiple sugar transport system substrate-binding protein